MAWKRFPTEDENIDPFNAPDPVMPIDEPVREELDLDDGIARLSRRNVRKRFQDASRTPKRAYQPPVHHDTSSTSSHPAVAAPEGSSDPADPVAATSPIANEEPIHGGYDQASRSKVSDASDSPAPSPVGSSHRDTHTWHRTSQQAPAPGGVRVRRKGGCGRMVIILIIVMFAAPTIAGSLFFSCSACTSDVVETFFSDADEYTNDNYSSSSSYADGDIASDVENHAVIRATAVLEAMVAVDETALDVMEQGVIDSFVDYLGMTPEELGLDAREIAAWVLENTSYETTSSSGSLYSEDDGYAGTANVYFDITVPSVKSIASNMSLELLDHEIYVYAANFDAAGLDHELVQELLAGILSGTSSYSVEYRDLTSSMMFNVTANEEGTLIDLELDEEAWIEELEWFAQIW